MTKNTNITTSENVNTDSSAPGIAITAREFLDVITGGKADTVWVCAVTDIAKKKDPITIGQWKGRRFAVQEKRPDVLPAMNCYYSIGLIQDGATSKATGTWMAGTILALDDVVLKTKVDPQVIRDCLGEPTSVTETSPGSQQWTYKLSSPVTDITTMTRLQKALTIKFYGGVDPGQDPVVQYHRLPLGINSKAEHVKTYGAAPTVKLVEWRPNATIAVVDAMLALGDAYTQTEGMHVTAHGLSGPEDKATAETYLDRDPALKGLEFAGRIEWDRIDNGYIGVYPCPWSKGHTGGEDDNRAGYNPDTQHYKCFHGSCSPPADRSYDALTCKVGELVGEKIAEIKKAATGKDTSEPAQKEAGIWQLGQWRKEHFRSFMEAHPLPPGSDGYGEVIEGTPSSDALVMADTAELADDVKAALKAAAAGTAAVAKVATEAAAVAAKSVFRKRRGTQIKPRLFRPLMSQYAVRGLVTSLVSRPNVGKSQFVVAQLCAIAAERPDLLGEVTPFLRPGGVTVISNEDGADFFESKVDGFLLDCGLSNDDLKHEVEVNEHLDFKVVQRPGQHMKIEITPEMAQVGRDIIAGRLMGLDTALVIVDTQASSFGSGIDENNNTDMGQCFSLLAKWAADHDVALEIVHHTTKEAWKSGAGGISYIRGAGATAGSVRIGLEIMEPTPSEEEALPESQKRTWYRVVITKHGRLAPSEWKDRWYQKKTKLLPTEYEDGTPGPMSGVPVSRFSKTGPKLGVDTEDDDLMFRAMTALIAREAAKKLPVAIISGGGDRACKLFGEALGVDPTPGGSKVQRAVIKRGFAEEEVRKIDGKERTFLAPTTDGHKFVEDYQAKLDTQGFKAGEDAAGEAADSQTAEQPVVDVAGQAVDTPAAEPGVVAFDMEAAWDEEAAD